MKFFESKFYQNRANRDIKRVTGPVSLQCELTVREFDANNISQDKVDNYYFAIETLSSRLRRFNRIPNTIIDISKFTEDTVLVEDLCHYTHSDNEHDPCPFSNNSGTLKSVSITDLDKVHTYFIPKIESFIVLFLKNETEVYDWILFHGCRIRPFDIGDYLVKHELLIAKPEPEIKPEIGILTQDPRGELDISMRPVEAPEEINFNLYDKRFKKSAEKITRLVEDEERKGLIILHGEPGTGKTTFIKWLSGQTNRNFVFVPAYMVSSLASPSFITLLLNNRGLVFVIEDAEEGLGPRSAGGSSVVSSLLNMTDGMLADILKCQFICTFNTELENIDSALLRPGRLLARHEFGKIDPETANQYLTDMGLKPTVKDPITLAQLVHLEVEDASSVEDKPTQKFGFV